MFKNSKNSYGHVSKLFHWLIFLLVGFMFLYGWYMVGLEDPLAKFRAYPLHKSVGILVLFLVILRVLWRFINISPSLPPGTPIHEKLAAQFVHFLLYILIIAIPFSGWAMSSAYNFPVSFFGLFVLPDPVPANKEMGDWIKEMHEILGVILLGVLVLHVGAALYHHFVRKDDILKRMLPFIKSNKNEEDHKTV